LGEKMSGRIPTVGINAKVGRQLKKPSHHYLGSTGSGKEFEVKLL
jgi:hypothetical protein